MTVSIQDFFKVTAANFDFENSQLYVIKIARHVWRLSFASFKKVLCTRWISDVGEQDF